MECFFKGNCFDIFSCRHRCKFFVFVLLASNLDHRTKTPDSGDNRFSRTRMDSDLSFCVDSFFSCSFNNLFMERIVKFSNHFVSFEISRGNFIEFLFYTCGESVIHNVFKILIQKVSYNYSNIAWKHFFLFCSGGLFSFISGDLSVLESKF